MRIELASAITRSWVRLYTRRLEADVRASRFGLMDFEPRVGTRLAASAVWLLFAVCMGLGLALRDRRPQRAGVLMIVSSVPALFLVWMVVPPLLGAAAIVGAIYHMTTAPSPTRTPA